MRQSGNRGRLVRSPKAGQVTRRDVLGTAVGLGMGSVLLAACGTQEEKPAQTEWRSLLSKAASSNGTGVVNTAVTMGHGNPQFGLNGAPYGGPVYFSYNLNPSYERQMAGAGVRVSSFTTDVAGTPYNYTPEVWKAENVWDYSALDQQVANILEGAPDALLLPRLYIAAPVWWLNANPTAKMVLDDGSTEFSGANQPGTVTGRPLGSLASPIYRQAMATAIEHLIQHVETTSYKDRIFGYILSSLATEEWYHWGVHTSQMGDYSSASQSDFQSWLRTKYGSDAGLQQAWNNPSVTLASADVPSQVARIGDQTKMFRDLTTEMDVIDWYSYYNDIVADGIDYFAGVAKAASGGSKLVGAWYCYMFEFWGQQEYGHMGVGRLVQSNALDFIIVTGSYLNRQLGSGGDYVRGPAHSIRLHGKAWYNDNDFATFLYPQVRARVGSGAYTPPVWYAVTTTAAETESLMRRVTGFCLGEGFQYGLDDLYGGAYDNPQLLSAVRSQVDVLQSGATVDQGRVSEILVVVDERSAMYASYANVMMGQALNLVRQQLTACGAPFDAILLDDLPLTATTRYKLIIFLNTYHMTSSQRDAVGSVAKRAGTTILWSYAPGLFNGPQRSVSEMSALLGLNMTEAAASGYAQVRLAGSEGVLGKALSGTGISQAQMVGAYGDVFAVKDSGATVLGVTALGDGTEVPTLAVKSQSGGWTAIYSGVSVLPVSWYREIARYAGVHIYEESGATFYASASFLTVSVDKGGLQTITLPHPQQVRNAFTGEVLAENTARVELALGDKESVVLQIAPPAHWW